MAVGMNPAHRAPDRVRARVLVYTIALLSLAAALAGCMHEEEGNGQVTDDGNGQDTDGGNGQVTELRFDDHPDLGSILVDGDGMTVYIFENDDPGESNCFDSCAENWPPLMADEVPDAPDNIQDSITLIDREGDQQVAHDDRPLYYFIQDEEAGDANGEGVNDVWFVVRESEA